MSWIAILLIMLSLFSSGSERPYREADYDWASAHFYPVLDELMPLKGAPGTYVIYRAHSESLRPEYWFSIGYDQNQDRHGLQKYLSAHVRMADTNSIFDQILRAHHSEPGREMASIQKGLKLKAFELTEMSCPAIKDQVEKLENIQTSVPKFHDTGAFIFGDRMRNEFQIQQNSEQMSLVLLEDLKSPPEIPLLNWAYWTRRALDSCAQTTR